MATRTIKICDRCKAVAETPEAIAELGLGELTIGFKEDRSYTDNTPRVFAAHHTWCKEWCRSCRAEVGVLEPGKPRQPDEPPVPDLETAIRAIIRSELETNQ